MSTATGFKLLLIEPCDDFRSIMTVLLELAGCEVRSVSNSTTALAIAATFKPDMILTELAEVDGLEIAHQLKSIPQVKDAHIVALTSFYWTGIEAEAANAGFTQYLLKPAAFDSLIQILASLALLHGKKLQLVNFAGSSTSVQQ
ncbi:response regulator [Massilia sp. UBA6681]|uniref:response regulator n=1 Tax=Massilia sp. UBA6681 TaxID=1946839 RepID=UPI0025C0A161|nr:response regulator [Massilia sp. UBA6681]